ncbi:MAG: polysaccharide biosynthesis protein [Firmicutes bacterium]|nr:polysaccharide biosynthesis protein [Bacillota bacterium]
MPLKQVNNMQNLSKRIALAVVDAAAVNLALYLALLLRFDGHIPAQYITIYTSFAWPTTIIALLIFYFCGFYRRLWRYTSLSDLTAIVIGATGIALLQLAGFYCIPTYRLPRSVIILTWILAIAILGAERLSYRLYRFFRSRWRNSNGKKDRWEQVIIVGAGDAGEMILRELLKRPDLGLKVAGFVDNDPVKQGLSIHGYPILGPVAQLPLLAEKYQVQQIIIAIPSAPGRKIREIIEICQETEAELKILPGVYELIDGQVTINHIKKVEIEDLLGRAPVDVNIGEMAGYLTGEVVLITGAGGSIGSELCRQIAPFDPARLLLLGHGENSIFAIHNELRDKFPHLTVRPLIADVQDKLRMEGIFATEGPAVIFHAAAHKHVPLMEANPAEAVKNNVLGTLNVVEAADKYGAKRFVLISTDKAVDPSSVMGASKRVAEIIVQRMGRESSTQFCAVRFGNVLGSRGSVVPLFRQQIAQGGPLTVTHPDMTRYFMTIPEAVQLVIQAGAMAGKGEIFILDMGEPMRIMDLARQMIKLSGFEPGKDIAIEITGIRPGEKMEERLVSEDETMLQTRHGRIFVLPNTGLTRKDIDIMDGLLSHLPRNLHFNSLVEELRGCCPKSPGADILGEAKDLAP